MSRGRLIDPAELVFPRRGSMLVHEALEVHKSHQSGLLHTRFAEFDRRSASWHAIREMVLGTNVLSADDERVFDVIFFFGPMPRTRALVWSRVESLPGWVRPWSERAGDGYVEIDPRSLPSMRARRPLFRPTPEALRAALCVLDEGLARRERTRFNGRLFCMGVDQWLLGLRQTIDGLPDARRCTTTTISQNAVDEIARIVGAEHIEVARWLRAMQVRKRSWSHWVPLARLTLERARAHVLTKHMDDATRRELYGLPEPPVDPPVATIKRSRRAQPGTQPEPSTRSKSDPASLPKRSTSGSPSTRRGPRSQTAT